MFEIFDYCFATKYNVVNINITQLWSTERSVLVFQYNTILSAWSSYHSRFIPFI